MAAPKKSNFDNYLRTHNAVKGEGFTHTRIGDKALNIFGGSYKINESEWKTFIMNYFQHVFVNNNQEYLTEKQLVENGPVMIDIDLRYDTSIKTKQHTKDHIIDAVVMYMEKIKELLDISDGAMIPVFVMEKKDVNMLENKTKDGIHMIIGVQMHKALQVLLRKKALEEIKVMWEDLPITNDWEDVLDEGVTKGFVNWQLYGSRKPGNQAYMIKNHFELTYTNKDWEIEECPLEKFSTEKNIYKLSAQYTDHPGFPMVEGIQDAFEGAKLTLNQNYSGGKKDGENKTYKAKLKLKTKKSTSNKGAVYADISNEEMLDNMIETLFEDIGPLNYRIKETHEYAMSLPSSYYGPGSYNKWIRVGMALYNTNTDLFLTWLKFSCQDDCRDTLKGSDGKFDWRMVPELYETWNKFSNNNPDCLTYRSILYWSKNDARDKYDIIHKDTIEFFINQTIQTHTATEFDLACVLYNMYKERFVCILSR